MTAPEIAQPTGSDGQLADRLSLADWRRRIADLYAEVRDIASRDPRSAWDHWRTVRMELYRTHLQSPVPADSRTGFKGHYWDYDPALRTEATVLSSRGAEPGTEGPGMDAGPSVGPDAGPGAGRDAGAGAGPGLALQLPISTGDPMSFTRIGTVRIPLPDGPQTLGLFWMAGYAGGLFLPFRDTTNGSSTYGAGRYLLDTAKGADLGTAGAPDRLILDFNYAFQPSCAFDPRWSCPLAPPENRLLVAITGGERLS